LKRASGSAFVQAVLDMLLKMELLGITGEQVAGKEREEFLAKEHLPPLVEQVEEIDDEVLYEALSEAAWLYMSK